MSYVRVLFWPWFVAVNFHRWAIEYQFQMRSDKSFSNNFDLTLCTIVAYVMALCQMAIGYWALVDALMNPEWSRLTSLWTIPIAWLSVFGFTWLMRIGIEYCDTLLKRVENWFDRQVP